MRVCVFLLTDYVIVSCRHCLEYPGTRHLLHTDPTASLSEPTDFMVAGGGNGYSYFVVDASTDVLFDGVELTGLGRLGDGYAALSLLLPGAQHVAPTATRHTESHSICMQAEWPNRMLVGAKIRTRTPW